MKLLTIISKEYREIVHKKSFIVSTILIPFLMAVFIFIPILFSKIGRENKSISLLDYSGFISKPLINAFQHSLTDTHLKLVFTELPLNDNQLQLLQNYLKQPGMSDQAMEPQSRNSRMLVSPNQLLTTPENKHKTPIALSDHLKTSLLNKETDAILIIPPNILQSRTLYFFALNISDFETNSFITASIQQIISEKILQEAGYPLETIQNALQNIVYNTYKVKKEGITESSSGLDYMLSIFMLTTLFTIIMTYGQIIMRGVLEEKTSRIVEVLLSSTRTSTLFYGKIIGIGLSGLTQILIWIAIGFVFVAQSALTFNKNLLSFFTVEIAVYFVIFFIIGYFMYAIFFAIVGAAVNTDQEAQQFASPITFLMFIPFILGIIVTQNPHTTLVTLSSFIPIFTPTLMFMRISVAVPDQWQIILSIFTSIVFTMFMAWIGAKIYRIGLLMIGKKPSIAEILHWIHYK
jgi:ABC-2 type transport system permease protein